MNLDSLFTTPAEKKKAIEIFESGIASPFWDYVCKVLDHNIESVRLQLEQGGIEGEDYSMVRELRSKLQLMRDMRETPAFMIKELKKENPTVPPVNYDPYDISP